MGLPDSRDVTLGPTDPVPSSLLDALQDQTIGMKHPAMDFPIPASAFQLVAGGTASLGAGEWTFGAVSIIRARIYNLAGTSLASITLGYNRGGAGNITFKVRKRNIVTGAAAADVASVVINAGAAWTTNVLPLAYVIEANMQLWVDIQCDNVAHVIGGCLLNARRG